MAHSEEGLQSRKNVVWTLKAYHAQRKLELNLTKSHIIWQIRGGPDDYVYFWRKYRKLQFWVNTPNIRSATTGKAPKAWAIPRFWYQYGRKNLGQYIWPCLAHFCRGAPNIMDFNTDRNASTWERKYLWIWFSVFLNRPTPHHLELPE